MVKHVRLCTACCLQDANLPLVKMCAAYQQMLRTVLLHPQFCYVRFAALQDANLPLAKMCAAYQQMLRIVRQLYQTCRLVHADLSEYNILVHKVRRPAVVCSSCMSGCCFVIKQ